MKFKNVLLENGLSTADIVGTQNPNNVDWENRNKSKKKKKIIRRKIFCIDKI